MSDTRGNGRAPTPRGLSETARHVPAWLRVGFESARERTGCTLPDCVDDNDSPTDLYCRAHSRFLPFATDNPGKTRKIVVNVLRALVLAAFPLAAQANTALPLDLLAAALGFGFFVLPLRLYPTTRLVAVELWIIACCVRVLLAIPDLDARRTLLTGVAGLTLLVFTLYFGELCARYGVADPALVHGAPRHLAPRIRERSWLRLRTPGRSAGVVAATAALTPGALLAAALLTADPGSVFWHAPHAVHSWLERTAGGDLLATLFAAAVAGFLHGALDVDTRVDEAFRPPKPADESSLQIVNVMNAVQYQVGLSLVRTANWTHRQLVIMGRRIHKTVKCTLQILRDAAITWCAALGHALRIVLVPVLCIAGAVGLIAPTGQQLLEYLVVGHLARLGYGLLGILAMSLLVCVAWIALCSEPLARAVHSARHNSMITGVWAGLFTAVGGLVVGLPGSFGHGRIHVGPLTLTLDIVFAGYFTVLQMRERRERRKRALAGLSGDGRG